MNTNSLNGVVTCRIQDHCFHGRSLSPNPWLREISLDYSQCLFLEFYNLLGLMDYIVVLHNNSLKIEVELKWRKKRIWLLLGPHPNHESLSPKKILVCFYLRSKAAWGWIPPLPFRGCETSNLLNPSVWISSSLK